MIIGASVGVFLLVIVPKYDEAKAIKADIATYTASIATATKLKQSRESLVTKYNSIPKADLDNIKTLLPDSVNNIKLIIQIDSLATKNGLTSLRNVDYNSDQNTGAGATATPTATPGPSPTPGTVAGAGNFPAGKKNPYGEFVMTFTTTGQYKNFLAFLSDMEQNLRIVDVTSISFSGGNNAAGSATSTESSTDLTHKVTIKTYWLNGLTK